VVTTLTTEAHADPIETVLRALRSQGHRITAARRILIQSLIDADGHRTVEELTADVQQRAPDVHLSTIYRNLEELEHLGLIERAHLGHGAATYHLASRVHGHLVCSECGTVVEIPDEFFRSLARRAETQHGFTIDPHHFAMIGRCKNCKTRAL
jgi:Fur family ferric uptake transcriptional regulator